jgi:hypothetical protein
MDDNHTNKILVQSGKMKVVNQVNIIVVLYEYFVSHM